MADKYQYHIVKCTDCGCTLAYSFTGLQQPEQILCYICAHQYAKVACYIMPIGSNIATHGLYSMDNLGSREKKRNNFHSAFGYVVKKLNDSKVAKVFRKREAELKK